MKKQYIGDGIYAEFDGFQIELKAESGGQDNVIYIDDHTWRSLIEFGESAFGALPRQKDRQMLECVHTQLEPMTVGGNIPMKDADIAGYRLSVPLWDRLEAHLYGGDE